MKDFIKVTKALSDPNRVKIIKMLQHKMMCVCEMREALQISQPSVSKHLKILEEAGLVSFKKDGLWVDYFLTDGRKSPYVASLMGNLQHWLEEDPVMVGQGLLLLGAIHNVTIPEADEIQQAIEDERARQTGEPGDGEGSPGDSDLEGGNYVM